MNFHAVSHSFPHRGPGASRARTRWQPYASNVTLSAISRSPSVYLHTPASSVSSNSPQTIHLPPICDHERPKAPLPPTPLANSLRESQRAKYAAKLVGKSSPSSSQSHSSPYRSAARATLSASSLQSHSSRGADRVLCNRMSYPSPYVCVSSGSRMLVIQIKRSKPCAKPGIQRTSRPSSLHVPAKPSVPSPNRLPHSPNALPLLLRSRPGFRRCLLPATRNSPPPSRPRATRRPPRRQADASHIRRRPMDPPGAT